jgi:type I restriction enzyme S subunit
VTTPLPFALTVPQTWTTAPFGRVVDRSQQSGQPEARSLSVFLEQGVVPRDARDDNFNRLGADLGKYLVVRKGDIVFNKLRTWQGGLGASRFDGIVSPAYFVCRPRPTTEPRYLHYLLRSRVYLEELTRISKWMPPSQFDISWDDLRSLAIPLPPLTIQRAIAKYLDRETARLDALIEARRRMVELLHERWQIVIHLAAAGRLARAAGSRRPTSIPWLADVPSYWREGLLKFAANLGTGHTPSRSHPEWWVDLTIPWITTGEVAQMRSDAIEYISETRERISELGMANSSATLHPAGTVVLCRTASAGYSAIMGRDMATSQDFATWTCGPLLRPRFLLLCLRVMRKDLLGRLAMGSTHKTIYMPDIESIKIPIPPLDEQDDLVAAAYSEHGQLDQLGSRIDAQIVLLRERRQALITAAVTGQLDISEAA